MASRRVNPFEQGTAERLLFDRYRKATAAAKAARQTEFLARTEADGYEAQANKFADALRSLGHHDKVPCLPAAPVAWEG